LSTYGDRSENYRSGSEMRRAHHARRDTSPRATEAHAAPAGSSSTARSVLRLHRGLHEALRLNESRFQRVLQLGGASSVTGDPVVVRVEALRIGANDMHRADMHRLQVGAGEIRRRRRNARAFVVGVAGRARRPHGSCGLRCRRTDGMVDLPAGEEQGDEKHDDDARQEKRILRDRLAGLAAKRCRPHAPTLRTSVDGAFVAASLT
jgi:hypothetical protein